VGHVPAAIAIAIDRWTHEHCRDQDRDNRQHDCSEEVNDTHRGGILSTPTPVRRDDFPYDFASPAGETIVICPADFKNSFRQKLSQPIARDTR